MEVETIEGYSLHDVAKMLDRSPSAIRRWIRLGWVDCGKRIEVNGTTTYVFNDEDVDQMRTQMTTFKPGPRTREESDTQ